MIQVCYYKGCGVVYGEKEPLSDGAPRAKPVVPPCSSAESAEAYPPTHKASEGYPLRIHPRP